MPEHPAPATPTAALPDWVPPPDVGLRITPCGVRFDAVRVNERLGVYAVELLAGRSRGVIADRRDYALYWLIRPGSAEGWQLPAMVYGAACYISVPAISPVAARYVHWLVPPAGDCLTDAEALRDALTEADAALNGPRPEAGREAER